MDTVASCGTPVVRYKRQANGFAARFLTYMFKVDHLTTLISAYLI